MRKFWEEYKKLDYFQRKDKLKTLPLLISLRKYRNDERINDEIYDQLFWNTLHDYINDIIDHEEPE